MLTDLPAALRKYDLPFVEAPGWKTRGHGPMKDVRGVLAHHTAGPGKGTYPSLRTVRDGRPGLKGPLAQIGLGRDGTVVLIAAGRSYHAGVGAHAGLTSGNSHLIGIEAESTGRGDWTPSQIEAYPRLVAALADHYGFDIHDWALAHKEWALPRGRKVDIHGWLGDIAGLRHQASSVLQRARDPKAPVATRPVPKPRRTAPVKAAITRKLVVDGKLAGRTVRALQRATGATVDGVWGVGSKRALQRHLKRKGYRLALDGVVGPATVRALQRYLHIGVDGVWGPRTTAAIQRRLNARTF